MLVRSIKQYEAIQWNGDISPYVIKDSRWEILGFGPRYYVCLGFTERVIAPGDWILLDNNYPVNVVSQQEFNQMWEPI